jgi:Leucine-rich repeat (LRR) protein
VRLSVSEGLSGQAATRLFSSPHYDRLRELHIGAGLTTAGTARAVLQSRVFKQLTTLSCRDDRAGGRTLVEGLTRLADPPRLKSLDLSGNRLAAEQIRALLAAQVLATVEELNLSDNNLRSAAVGTIAAADLPKLRSLHLLRTQPEEAGVHALAGSELFAGLRSLSLGGNNLPPSVAVSLAAGPGAANLRVLDLRENRLGDAGATTLAESPHLKNLVHLDLATNFIEDDGAEALADSPHLGGLICLDLHGNITSSASQKRLKQRFGDRVFV